MNGTRTTNKEGTMLVHNVYVTYILPRVENCEYLHIQPHSHRDVPFCLPTETISVSRSRKPCQDVGRWKDVVGALTLVVGGVAKVFHDLLVELRLLLVAEVEEGEK